MALRLNAALRLTTVPCLTTKDTRSSTLFSQLWVSEWTIEFEYHRFEICNLVPELTLDRFYYMTGICENCCAHSMIGVIHIYALFTIFDPPAKRETWPTPHPLLCNCPAEPLPRGSLEYDFWIKFCCDIFFLLYNWQNLWPFISQSIALFQRPKQIMNVRVMKLGYITLKVKKTWLFLK